MKRVLPVLLFGVLAAGVALPLLVARSGATTLPWEVFVPPVILAVVFFAVFKRLVFDLADEVVDEGDALRVRYGAEEERVPLAEIINVSYSGITNPKRVTLTLRTAGRFGRELTFSPAQRPFSNPFRTNPLVRELIERVDAARRR